MAVGEIMAKNFVAVLGKGRGTWGHVARLIREEEWGNIFLVSNDFGKDNFAPSKECDWLLLNSGSDFESLKEAIKEKLPEGELAVSLISGTGKEHTALLAALKEAKKGYELVILTSKGTKYY